MESETALLKRRSKVNGFCYNIIESNIKKTAEKENKGHILDQISKTSLVKSSFVGKVIPTFKIYEIKLFYI